MKSCYACCVFALSLIACDGAALNATNDTRQLHFLEAPVQYRLYTPGQKESDGSREWRTGRGIFAFPVSGEYFLDLRFRLPADLCRDPALYFGLSDQSFRVFVDGESVYASGDVAARSAGVRDWPRPFHIIPLPAVRSGPGSVELRFYSNSNYVGVLEDGPRFGCHKDIIASIVREDALRFGIGALALLAVLISLGASFRARKLVAIRSFSLLCLCIGAFVISNRTLRIQYLFYDSLPFWFGVETLATYLTPPALILFVRSTIGRSPGIDILFGFSSLTFIVVLGMYAAGIPAYRFIYVHYALAFICLGGLVLIAARTPALGSITSRFTLAGLLIFALGVSYDILGAAGFVPWSDQILSFTFFGMLLFIAAGTVRRNHAVEKQVQLYQSELEEVNERLRESNASLEDRVRRRTDWLRGSLKRVNELRGRQESDYFLTARLMEPTRFRGLRRGGVSISAFIEQKKKYAYGPWAGDIGGDFCVAHPLEFASGNCVCFLNGDAMGKSLQGAGGAIVLAASFRAILNRQERLQKTGDPGDWLANCYFELQDIFNMFAGRMVVSLIVGAVHIETGRCLYINAGHPPLVMLRRGRAGYLAEKLSPALGVSTGQTRPALNEFQLGPGDVALIGSDGREDLLVADGVGEKRRISIAEEFPGIVGDAGGDLERIVVRLEELGEIADDISVMKIKFDR